MTAWESEHFKSKRLNWLKNALYAHNFRSSIFLLFVYTVSSEKDQ